MGKSCCALVCLGLRWNERLTKSQSIDHLYSRLGYSSFIMEEKMTPPRVRSRQLHHEADSHKDCPLSPPHRPGTHDCCDVLRGVFVLSSTTNRETATVFFVTFLSMPCAAINHPARAGGGNWAVGGMAIARGRCGRREEAARPAISRWGRRQFGETAGILVVRVYREHVEVGGLERRLGRGLGIR